MSSVFDGLSSTALRKAVSTVKRHAKGKTWPIVVAVGMALVAGAALWFGIIMVIRLFV